jgi:hypothetical protein
MDHNFSVNLDLSPFSNFGNLNMQTETDIQGETI